LTARQLRLNPTYAAFALGIILAAALALRLYGINWDAGQHLHPDERFIVMVDNGIQWPHSLTQYFDSATSPLNPYNRGFGNFVYGTLPVFLLKLVATLLHRDSYDGALLVGRVLSAVSDLGSVWLVFLAGRRLYGQGVGLLAAAFLTLSVLSIQLSHFMAVDTFTLFFLMVSFYYAVRYLQQGGWGSVAGMGFGFGLALACKLSIALAPVLMIGAIAVRIVQTWPRPQSELPAMAGGAEATPGLYIPALGGTAEALPAWTSQPARERVRDAAHSSLWQAVFVLGVSLFCAAIAFRLFQPYAFQGLLSLSPKWLADEASQRGFIAGTADVPFLLQWAHTTPIVFPLKDIVLYGMGWPLGLLGLAGLAVGGYQLLWHCKLAHLLPAAWIVSNLLYLGLQQSKTMRYFYQLYPFLALMAAWLVIEVLGSRSWVPARNPTARVQHPAPGPSINLGLAVGAFVLVATALNAFAFTRIYTRPNTRVAASEWIYDNIPAGKTLAVEHWDDVLPLGLGPGKTADRYKTQTLTLYDDDNQAKIDMIVQGLSASDYLILSSNRLYGSITRIPQRYPITTEYYNLLFSGQLGFRLVDDVSSYPTLFGIPLKDDRVMGYQGLAAQLQPDEAFTVYDHPHVLIFQKTPDFSPSNVRELLSAVPWQNAQRLTPKQASLPTTQLTLSPRDMAADAASGTWSALFNPGSLMNRVPILAWWLSIELLGAAAFPLIFLALRGLWDGGWLFSKPAALLLLAYIAWLPASLHVTVFSRSELTLAALVVLCGSLAALAWRRAETLEFVHAHWRRIAIGEGLFAVLFAFFMVVRMSNPDLWHPIMGGEKPMDFAFLNATLKSAYFPPYDPWFSGGYINYYYFGFVIVGSLIKLLGIEPYVGYNLAVAVLPAFTGIGAFAIVASLVSWRLRLGRGSANRPWLPLACGFAAVVLVVIIGNLGDIPLLLQQLRHQPIRIEWWYWNATREIPEVINELPFFTFLYGDLHAHAIALPYTVLAIGAALALVLSSSVAGLLLLALVVGALKPTNTWDFPTYFVLATAFLIVASWPRWQRALVKAAGVLLVATLLFQPYAQHFATLYSSIEPWTGKRTPLEPYLIVHGIFLFIIACYLLNELLGVGARAPLGRLARLLVRHRSRLLTALRRAASAPATSGRRLGLAYWADGLAMFSLLLLVLALLKLWLPLVLLVLLAMAALALFSPDTPAHKRLTYILIGLGLSLSLATEFVVIQGDVGRMNTVFKLDLQVWVLWALASALALYDLATELRPWQRLQRSFVFGGASILIAAGLTYPVAAGIARAHDRFAQLPLTDNGEAYMAVSTWQDQQPIPLKPDYEAITWLQQNIQGSPVILEGRGRLYSWANRVSIYTGLPTVLGWDWHEIQQRGLFGDQDIQRRANDVLAMYSDPSLSDVMPLLRRYGVRYIYVGPLERETYSASGLAKFQALPAVYDHDGVVIYEVSQS
jgi:YYY domain-containing protein